MFNRTLAPVRMNKARLAFGITSCALSSFQHATAPGVHLIEPAQSLGFLHRMWVRQGHGKFNPKGVSARPVFHQVVSEILGNQYHGSKLIVHLGTNGQVSSPIPPRVDHAKEPVIGGLLVKIPIGADCQFLGEVMHCHILPEKLIAGMVLGGGIGVVHDVLQAGTDFRSAVLGR